MPTIDVAVTGGGPMRTIMWRAQTTDATPILLPWVNLPSTGSGAWFNSNITAQQSNADRGFGRTDVGQVNRNSIGVGFGNTIAVGSNGYTDTVATPWTTGGTPAGWGAQPYDLSASPIVQFGLVGAAGQTTDWLFVVDVYLWGGAILLV